jgi:hypothetical protein
MHEGVEGSRPSWSAARGVYGPVMRLGIAPAVLLAILVSGCGGTTPVRPPSAKAPLSVPASAGLCPPSDAKPRGLLLTRSATDVLVPGHPTRALICRYWGREDEHAIYTIAGARRVLRLDVTSYLASELDALPPIGPHPNCDEVLGDRSELIVFYYRGHGEARVIFFVRGCVAVGNGRTARYGLGMGHGDGEAHWADEGLL